MTTAHPAKETIRGLAQLRDGQDADARLSLRRAVESMHAGQRILEEVRPRPPFVIARVVNADLRADIDALTGTVRRFALERIAPNADAWDKQGMVPRELYREAAGLGLLGLGYPEEFGGTSAPFALRNAMSVTLARHGGSGPSRCPSDRASPPGT